MSDGCGFDESLSGPEVGPIPVSDPRHPFHGEPMRRIVPDEEHLSDRAWRVAQLAAVVLGGSYADRGLDLADRELSADVSWSIQMARALLAEAERAEGGGA